MRKLVLLLPAIATACPYRADLLANRPRAAEAIDHVPIDRPVNDRPVEPALSRLSELVAQARGGDLAFRSAADQAEQLAAPPERRRAGAGSPRSRRCRPRSPRGSRPAARSATSTRSAPSGSRPWAGIAPNDLAAIQDAGAEVVTIDQRQAQTIAAIQRRLGL